MKITDKEKEVIIDAIHERVNGTNHDCFLPNKDTALILKKFFKDCISKKHGEYMFAYGKFNPLKYPDLYIEAYRREINWVDKRFFPQNE